MHQSNPKLLQSKLKNIVSTLNEKDLKKLLDKFLELSSQFLDKNSKEISYKCFESVILIRHKKAVGYGRTENEAYTSAVRNILELLLEDQRAMNQIKQAIKRNMQLQQQQQSIDEDKENITKIQLDVSKYEKKNGPKKPPLNALASNNNFLNMSLNEELTKSKSRISIDNLNVSNLKVAHHDADDELKKAKYYIQQLESKLKSILEENNTLKEQLQPKTNQQPTEKYRSTSYEYSSKNMNSSQHHNQSIMQSDLNTSTMQDKKKPNKVPRLKLQILPNYHGKSNKCLNQALLAAYQEKHKKF